MSKSKITPLSFVIKQDADSGNPQLAEIQLKLKGKK